MVIFWDILYICMYVYIYIRIAAGSPIWTEVRLSLGGTVDACEILHRKDGWKPKVFDHSFHWNLLKSASLWSMFNFSPRRKGTERLDNAFLGDAEEGHGQCRQWKGSEWKGNMSSQDVRTADGHFSNLFGFDFVYQRVATRLKGCKIFALSLVMVEGGRTTAGNPRGCNITVLKPWCSGRSYVFFFRKGTWPDSQNWNSNRSICLEKANCLPRIGWLVANLITCYSISVNLTCWANFIFFELPWISFGMSSLCSDPRVEFVVPRVMSYWTLHMVVLLIFSPMLPGHRFRWWRAGAKSWNGISFVLGEPITHNPNIWNWGTSPF